MTDHVPKGPHLEAGLVSAYVDRRLGVSERADVEAHLAQCIDCRTEVVEVHRLISRHWAWLPWSVVLPLAAAAGLLLMILPNREQAPTHRGQTQAPDAPVTLRPIGSVATVDTLRWSLVVGADRYRFTVFDAAGMVLWEGQTNDSVAAWPGAVRLLPRAEYYWKVEARVGLDHWTSSPLVEFTLSGRGPPP
jgi:anti-sigma factor RsiW